MSVFSSIGRFVHKNTPIILTSLGAAGVVSTAILAARSHADAQRHLRYQFGEDTDGGPKLDWMVKVKETWRYYLPPVISGGIAVTCIFAAQVVNSKRQAVLIGIIAVGQETLQEYREATNKIVGPKKEQEIYDEIADRRVERSGNSIAILDSGDILVQDSFTKQYFGSTVEKIRKAQNDVMEMVLFSEGSASQNDFARAAGIVGTDMGEEVGYNPDNPLEVIFSTSLTDTNIPVLVINYRNQPKFNYNGVW